VEAENVEPVVPEDALVEDAQHEESTLLHERNTPFVHHGQGQPQRLHLREALRLEASSDTPDFRNLSRYRANMTLTGHLAT